MKYDELNIRDRAAVIKAAVSHGARSLQDVRNQWNTFAEGGQESTPVESKYTAGNTTNTLWEISGQETYGTPNYNNTISEEEAKRRGWYKTGANGHSDDRVKLENHPTHPSRGTFNDRNSTYEFTDKGMEDPNLTLFGMVDNGDGRYTPTYKEGIVLPELTVNPKENYYNNTYDNIKLHTKALGGNIFDEGGQEDTTDAAMQVITNNRNKLDRKYDFIVDTWDSEFNGKPKGYNEETGLYFPYKSAEGGMPTVGPGLKVRPNGKGDAYSFTESEVANGVTKAQIDEKLGNNSELQYEKVLEFLNQKGNRLPTDTISPSIMRGLMDLRYQTGSLGSFNNLREAVLNGDLKGIKKESRVFYKNNGKNVPDKRRNQHRAERFWHYNNGGNLFSTGGVMYPFSFNGNIPQVRY